jgi:predicted CopG family antitoxin
MSNLIKVVGVRITEDAYTKLKTIADARGEDISDFIRRAILKEFAALNFLSEFESKALGVNLKLNPWNEVCATYNDLTIDENNLILTLTTTPKHMKLTFPKDSPEANIITKTLQNIPKGTKIALLATDIPEKPLLVRIFNNYPCKNTLKNIPKNNHEKPQKLTEETQSKNDPKFERKKQVPQIYPDPVWSGSLIGAFSLFGAFVLKLGIF